MSEFFGQNWRFTFALNHLNGFNDFWSLETSWFEEPNYRRGGWSGVSRLSLSTDTAGNCVGVFLKRQENHSSRTFNHPISGVCTFQKEYNNILLFNKLDIPTLELAYYGESSNKKDQRAVLITKELTGYVSIDNPSLLITEQGASVDRVNKDELLVTLANITRKMHQHRVQHNCFYPKHIFAKYSDEGWLVRFIDLEKAKRTVFQRSAIIRDLSTLSRHAHDWTTRDRLTFFKAYMNEDKLSKRSKRLWHIIEKKVLAKAK